MLLHKILESKKFSVIEAFSLKMKVTLAKYKTSYKNFSDLTAFDSIELPSMG